MPENHKTKLVLFDLDGTLVDTAPDFLISLNNILKKYNRPKASIEGVKHHISEGTSKLIKFFFEIDETDLNFKKYRSEFLAEYEKNLTNESRLFSGIPELIEFLDLNSIRYGVVTNKFYKYAKPVTKGEHDASAGMGAILIGFVIFSYFLLKIFLSLIHI